MMNVSEPEFKFMVEGITSDLICMLCEREKYTTEDAVDAVYNSNTYSALTRFTTGLYAQSSGYVYEYLIKELKA